MKKTIFILFLSIATLVGFSNAEEVSQGNRCGYNWDIHSSQLMGQQINDIIIQWGLFFDKWTAAYNIWDYINAATYFKQSYDICPEQPAKTNLVLSYQKLWYGYRLKKDYNTSIDYYLKAFALQPNEYNTLFNIWADYANLNDNSNALIYYKKALDATFNEDEIKQVTERINQLTTYTTTNTTKNITTSTTTSIITNTTNNELSSAILWMYNNWLTSYSTVDKFMWNDYLTREQASKFFLEFATKILGKLVDVTKTVSLNDIQNANETLQFYIKESVQLWLFKWIKWNFLPSNKLTRAQAIAVIIRIKDWTQDETSAKWYNQYYNMANNYWVLDWLWFDYNTLDSLNIKRSGFQVFSGIFYQRPWTLEESEYRSNFLQNLHHRQPHS